MARRILVTGGAGFIGSHVIDALLRRGDDVHAFDDLSKGDVGNIPEAATLHVGDVAGRQIGKLFAQVHFDAVVHCAAQTNVMRSLVDPDLDWRINVAGLERVIKGATSSGVSRFVFISSGGAAYGETPEPASESTPTHPRNPYGEHKIEGEHLVDAASMPAVSLRLSNVYGARQRSDAEGGVISIFADRLASGLPLQVYGDGAQERDFVHVDDVVAAIILALDEPAMEGIWNVGTGVGTSINELVELMLAASPANQGVEYLPERQEIRRSCLDVSKLCATGRWAPRHELADGIAELARTMSSPRAR